MTEVLNSMTQVWEARKELRRRGLSCLDSIWVKYLRACGLLRGVSVGDTLKSWDVLKTARVAEQRVRKDQPILDIGAYASEVLCVLRRLGYTDLTGVDLNPGVRAMPRADAIKYVVSDFMETPFPDQSFQMITAVSVIEHGFDSLRLLKEVSRLLRWGGVFVVSFDYWPEKIHTIGIRLFDMEWRIFSREEVHEFVKQAMGFELIPAGELNLSASDRPIHCAGKEYTFAWLALEKRDGAPR